MEENQLYVEKKIDVRDVYGVIGSAKEKNLLYERNKLMLEMYMELSAPQWKKISCTVCRETNGCQRCMYMELSAPQWKKISCMQRNKLMLEMYMELSAPQWKKTSCMQRNKLMLEMYVFGVIGSTTEENQLYVEKQIDVGDVYGVIGSTTEENQLYEEKQIDVRDVYCIWSYWFHNRRKLVVGRNKIDARDIYGGIIKRQIHISHHIHLFFS